MNSLAQPPPEVKNMPHSHEAAQQIAMRLCQQLEPAVSEIVIAGSLRRGKREVKDIELVACLLEDVPARIAESRLDAAILRLIQAGELAWDTSVKRAGPRYKRFVLPERSVIESGGDSPVIELFIAVRENYGNILTIRTGAAEFTHKLVTDVTLGGLMPENRIQHEGFLMEAEKVQLPRSEERPLWEKKPLQRVFPCPTEAAFFAALGLPVLKPAERNLAGVRKLRDYLNNPPMTLPRTEDDSDLPHWAR